MGKKMDSRFRGNDVKRTKREPRWVIAFLRALERCGHARASAKDAGIDHTTAYARRKAHGDFADAWAAALAAHKLRRKREEAEELEAFVGRLPSPGSPVASPTSPAGGSGEEELVLVNGRMKRVGREGWGKRKEKLFFDELMATNNIRRAAKAAGVSENEMHQRRLKHPLFRAKWEAVEQCCKAGLGMYLLEATAKHVRSGHARGRGHHSQGQHRRGDPNRRQRQQGHACGAAGPDGRSGGASRGGGGTARARRAQAPAAG
jgi:hypothetical protein